MQLRTPPSVPAAQLADFFTQVLEQIESVHGVTDAGFAGDLFISGSAEQLLTAEGDVRTTSERVQFRRDEVSPEFFKVVGTPLLRGRFFSTEDRPDSPPVAIVNDAMARRVWPGRDPVGQRFKLGPEDSNGPWSTVVGVVGDMRRQGPERDPIPQMFEPQSQNPSRLATLLVRTSLDDPLTIVGTLRAAVRRVDKHVPLYGETTLENRLGDFLAVRRFQTSLVVGFAGVALLLAAIGIYGLIQYSVAARTQEIGIRMAVGAQAGDIFRMMIGEGLTLSATGLVLGLVGGLWVGHAARSFLFGVTATDPLTFLAVSLLLTAVAIAASYFPARRAVKIDPIVALRVM
jgi:putative ABC transport system permease protein